jgi:prepilin-type N-terminal cleavage/methylation domain-containing protein
MSKGFTLIEIMIVVVVIGMLLAIAIPSFVKAKHDSEQKALKEAALKENVPLEKGAVVQQPVEVTPEDIEAIKQKKHHLQEILSFDNIRIYQFYVQDGINTYTILIAKDQNINGSITMIKVQ